MTYAPDDLKAVQRYAHAKTGQDWASLGITHQTPQGGGYHEGHDLLHAADTAPEDPGSDYSYTESQRDRNGLTDAASAFDLGGNFPRFYEFNAWIVGRARAGDPRARDIREIIHTLDGRVVRRFDALGIRSSGDSSHLTHTHISFFRDSEGRRAQADNFLGLLQEFFDGATPTPEVPDMTPEQADALARVERIVTAQCTSAGDTRGPGETTDRQGIVINAWPGGPKVLPNPIAKVRAEVAAARATVTLDQAAEGRIVDGVVAKLASMLPTAATVADELAKRLGNG